jgi:hypothetical protein
MAPTQGGRPVADARVPDIAAHLEACEPCAALRAYAARRLDVGASAAWRRQAVEHITNEAEARAFRDAMVGRLRAAHPHGPPRDVAWRSKMPHGVACPLGSDPIDKRLATVLPTRPVVNE